MSDPPYGIGYNPEGGDGAFGPKRFFAEDRVVGDDEDFDPSPLLCRFPQALLWGANHYARLLPKGGRWLVWDKREGCTSDSFSDCEIAWCSNPGNDRMFSHLWKGGIKRSEHGPRVHPTQKSVAVMQWCLEFVNGETVVDPYMGSGSTLVATELCGRSGFGVEIKPEHFDTACRRVEQAVIDRDYIERGLFPPKAVRDRELAQAPLTLTE